MRLSYFFLENRNIHSKIHPFKEKSKFSVPAFADNPIEKYIFYTKMELSKYVPKTEFNLSLQERNCLKNLKHDENIIIHKADKNNVTVIQNLSDYLEEGEKQLNDNIHYEQIQDINLKNTQKKVYEIIYKMKEENCIDEISFKYIKNEQNYIKTPFAYFLPKIHKLDREVLQNIENENNQIKTINVPGRPIISQCNGPLERLGRYLDYFLLPLVKTQKTYISDTGDLIRNIENCTFDNNVLLVTYDITSLYTNLRFEEITEALQKALDEHDKIEYSITKPTNNFLIEITKLILSNNEFTFHGKSYRQIIGASMGATASPEICDIAIYNHINSILKNSPISEKIIFHKRMRDDGLLMVKAKESEIDFMFENANKQHDLLKFTYECNKQSIKFLDLEIFKGERFKNTGVLDLKCFTKKTEKFQYLHKNSNHPISNFKSFIKGEGIRILRNTNNESEFQTRKNLFIEKLLIRGYKRKLVEQILSKIKFQDRQIKLKKKNKVENKYNVSFITNYHPQAEKLQKVFRKYWHLIKTDSTIGAKFHKNLSIGFKRNRNIGELVKRTIK